MNEMSKRRTLTTWILKRIYTTCWADEISCFCNRWNNYTQIYYTLGQVIKIACDCDEMLESHECWVVVRQSKRDVYYSTLTLLAYIYSIFSCTHLIRNETTSSSSWASSISFPQIRTRIVSTYGTKIETKLPISHSYNLNKIEMKWNEEQIRNGQRMSIFTYF